LEAHPANTAAAATAAADNIQVVFFMGKPFAKVKN